jgi:hypothetical protein
MTQIVVLYHVNGTTSTAHLSSPGMSVQMHDGGIHLRLFDDAGAQTGWVMFTRGGVVPMQGTAVEQVLDAGQGPA